MVKLISRNLLMQHAVTGLGAFLTTLIKTVLVDTVI